MSDAAARGAYERTGGQDAAIYCARVEARSILSDNETVDGCIGFSESARTAMVSALRRFDAMSLEDVATLQTR